MIYEVTTGSKSVYLGSSDKEESSTRRFTRHYRTREFYQLEYIVSWDGFASHA